MLFRSGDRGLYLYYTLWQIGVVKIFRQLVKEIRFDYAWHLSFGSWWMPTFLPLVGLPFIYGPLGGGDGVPRSFFRALPLKDRIIQSFRYVLTSIAIFNPIVMFPACKAKAILCRTENNRDFLPFFLKRKSTVILETAMDMDELGVVEKKECKSRIEFITTGRLVPFKNLKCAIDALAIVRQKYDFHYTIIGKGPETDRLKKQIMRLGLLENIEIKKQMPRDELLCELKKADVFLFPSLREGGSWALMEALALSLPTICLNWTGMKMITDEKCAIQLQVSNPHQMTNDFANAICRLIENPKLRKEMGLHARERMRDVFNWEAKGNFADRLLDKLDKECFITK